LPQFLKGIVAFLYPNIMALQIGDTIPLFSLPDQNGNTLSIESLYKTKILVLYFYPKDETYGCTKQACAFRDNYHDFINAGAQVVGISSDHVESHKNFAQHHNIPYTLLYDQDGYIRNIFGVQPNLLGLVPGRVTYIIDMRGIIRYIFSSQMQIQKHIEIALREVKKIQ